MEVLTTPIRRVLKDNADIALQLIIGREMKAASDDAIMCRKSTESAGRAWNTLVNARG